jgi:histidinol-phosphatase
MWFAAAGKEIEFLNLVHKTNVQRGFGDWYGHVLVAQGSGEIIVDHGLKIWDLAAIMPIVEEAGGRMTDWNGERRCDRPDVLVSNGKLHDAVLGVLRRTA